MYREKIREYYDRLSRSYRKVADFALSNYYEVAFMTAAQLAYAVGVDTTTVVRFSQRLGYNGYPELLNDIREQVRAEIYASYLPAELSADEPQGIFKERAEQERHNLQQMLTHNPPEHIRAIANMFGAAERILLLAEGYANTVAELTAEQLRHRGIAAEYVADEPVKRAATLANLQPQTLVIGISATQYGDAVARALEYTRTKHCMTLGVVGSLASPVNRVAESVLFAPTETSGPLPSIVAITAALSALVQIASKDNLNSIERYLDSFDEVYHFLTAAPALPAEN
ncbi:MAG: MurR/RpiR family transcriptional regulator [Caldilineaceae bacterium]